MTENYDIFISYRRDAFESANLFATRLKALGYRVFFDIETMNAGKFNEQLLDVISKCKDFILVLSPNALDRCKEEGDWVRREVMCAMEHKKNIIPIMLSGFEWPKEMPKGLEELCMYQAIAPLPNIYYDMQIKKLQGYLQSKAHFQTRRKWIGGLCIMAAVIALLLTTGHLTFMPVALRVTEAYTLRTQAMDNLAEISSALQTDWEQYVSEWKQSKNKDDRADYKEKMYKLIDLNEREGKKLLKNLQATPINVPELYLPLFWLKGIPPHEILLINSSSEELFDNLQEQIDHYRTIMEDDNYQLYNLHMAKIYSEIISVFTAGFYYSYMQMLSHLPASTHKSFYEVSPQWTHLPNAGIGLSDKEYERQQKLLIERLNREFAYQEQLLLIMESDLAEQEAVLDSLEAKADELLRVADAMDTINRYIQQLQTKQ